MSQIYYYYDAQNNYVGCGNESTPPAGCTASAEAPVFPEEPNPRIAELKAELAALDIKRIRPTAEGDTAYLATLNAQAVALRAELQALL